MKETILTIVVGLLLTIVGLFIEKCYFEGDNCPVKSMNATASKSPKLADFKINYLYRSGGKGEPQSFGKKHLLKYTTLTTGDTYKIIFQPSAKNHVYIFQVDSANKITRLFPTTDFAKADKMNANPVQKNQKYFVPAKDWSFELDATTGKETIYTIVSDKPDENLEQQYATMLAQQDNQTPQQRKVVRRKWNRAMKEREVRNKLIQDNSKTIKWTEGEQKLSTTLFNLQKMCDGCVNIVHFKHK